MEKDPKNGDYSLMWHLIHDLPFFSSHTPALSFKNLNEVLKKIHTLSLQYPELPKGAYARELHEPDFIPGSLKKENHLLVDFYPMNGRKLVFGRKTDFSETFGEPIRELYPPTH